MKKKKLIIIITAIVLVLALLLGSIWFFFLKGDGEDENTVAAPLEKIDALRLTMTDQTLLNTDFTDYSFGTLPEGWDKTHPYTFLENGDKSTSLETETGNKSHVTIRQLVNYSCLSFSGRDGEHILTSASTQSENYMITAKVNFAAFKTPFGIVTDIPDDYKSANRATLLTISAEDIDTNPNDDLEIFVPTFTVSHRVTGKTNFVKSEKNVSTVKVADVDRSAVVVSNNKTGESTIPNDIDVELKAIHFNNVTYFYLNDNLIAAIDDYDQTTATRFGFFSNTNGREVHIKSLRVDTIKAASDYEAQIENLAVNTEADFTTLTEIPKGYKLYSGQWVNKAAMGTAEIKNGGLTFSSKGGATAFMLPVQKSNNYHLTAEIKIGAKDGSFGLVSGVSDPLSGSRGGNIALLSADGTETSLYKLEVSSKKDLKEYKVADIKNLTIGETVKLEVYNYNSISYFYINGVFVGYFEYPKIGKASEFCGIYTEDCSQITLLSVKNEMLIKKESCEQLKFSQTALSLKDGKAVISLSAELFKNTLFSQLALEGKNPEFGIIAAPSGDTAEEITVGSKNLLTLTDSKNEDTSTLYKHSSSLVLSSSNIADYYSFRAYVKVGDKHFYSQPVLYCPGTVASDMYLELSSKNKDIFDTLFKDRAGYIGKYEKTLTFTLFSDFHYKKGMYASTIADMQSILDRANKSGSSFLLSGGDFCNDFAGSPELLECFLNNNYNLPVYNVYGNHELEAGNSMNFVTPRLTNDKNVIWGTDNGLIGDGSIGYYYFDTGTFRIVCTDSNYSYNPSSGEWEHNYTGSYGYPSGNTKGNSLGPVQLDWLEEVLTDAANKGKSCIIIGHDSYSGKFRSTSPDATAIRSIYSKVNSLRKGTVMLSINGHIHANNTAMVDGVLYIDTNATRNVVWRGTSEEHYSDNHTFDFVDYDSNGNPIGSSKKKLNDLTMGKNTWFTADPLSAVVSISQYGTITVEGSTSSWLYNVNPQDPKSDEVPYISSGKWELLK